MEKLNFSSFLLAIAAFLYPALLFLKGVNKKLNVKKGVSFLAIITLSLCTLSGTAQLASWPNSWSGVAASPLTAPTKNANILTATIERVSLTGVSSSARYNSSNWAAGYLLVTIVPNTGSVLNMNSQTIVAAMGSSGTGPNSFTLQAAVNGGTTYTTIGTMTTSCSSSASTTLTLPSTGYSSLTSIRFKILGTATGCSGTFGSGGTGGPASLAINGAIAASATAPVVTLPTATAITGTTVTLGGTAADGGSALTQRGVVYAKTSLNGTPAIGGANVSQTIVSGTATGAFTTTNQITGLTPSTAYSYRAYATNAIGTGYTTTGTFTTSAIAPVITSVLTANGNVGTAFTSYTITANNSPTTFNATGLPPGLTRTGAVISGTPTTAGTYNVSISAGNTAGTDTKTLVITIGKQDQTITGFDDPIPDKFVGEADFALSAVASSGLPVTYISTDETVATVSGNMVHIVGPGQTAIIAYQEGDDNYNAADNSGTIQQILTVIDVTEPPVITSESSQNTFVGVPYSYTITASNGASGFGATGLPPGLTISGATISGTPTTDGVYDIHLTATNSGGTGEGLLTLVINKQTQTITFNPLDVKLTTDADFALTALSTSGLDIVYISSNPSVATISGNMVHIVGQGTTTITASQPGNSTYEAATDVAQDLLVTSAQTITFGALGNKVYGDADFALTATASSGLAVTYISSNPSVASISGNIVHIEGAGNTTITASQSGDATYFAAPDVPQSFTVTKKELTVTGATAVSKTYNASATATITGATLAGVVDGDNVTIATSTGTFASPNVGTAIAVTANLTLGGTDAGNYTITQPTGLTANITKANQTISFTGPINKTIADGTFAPGATATSGLTITYTSSNTAVATVSGTNIVIVGAGTSTITASQAGNANYNAATSVQQTLTVTSNPVAIWTDPVTGSSSTNPYASSDRVVAANLTVVGIGAGSGVTLASATGRYSSSAWNITALDANKYFYFTLTPAAGYQISLSSLAYTTQASNTGPTAFSFKSSLDNYVANVTSGSIANNASAQAGSVTFPATFQNVQSSVTFRFYPWGASASAGTFSFNDYTFNGLVTCITPTISAGTDQTVCSGAATLAASAIAAPVTSGAWTVVSGPSTATSQFSSTSSPTATFTPAGGPGAYTLRWTATTPCTSVSDDVVINYGYVWTGLAGNNLWSDAGNWGTCGVPGTNAKIVIPSGKNTTLNTNYTVGTAGSLTLQSGSSFTIAPTATLTVAGPVNFADQPVTVKSDITGTGSIGQVTGSLLGATNVTVERYIPANAKRAWRLLSVPTAGTQTFANTWQLNTLITSPLTTGGFDEVTPAPSLLTYNTATNIWDGVTSTASSIVTKGGFFLYVRGDRTQSSVGNPISSTNPTTLRTTGPIYVGNQSKTLKSEFDVIGNVYASAIDFAKVDVDGLNGIDDLFYVWDPKVLNQGSSLGAYQAFNGTNDFETPLPGGSYGAANSRIESGQAFIVRSAAHNGTITLKESHKATGSANAFRPADAAKKVKLKTSLYTADNNIADANIVVFDNAYSDSVDGDDALKLPNTKENFGISRNNKTLVIEGRQSIVKEDVIPFDMWNMEAKTYKLSFVGTNVAAGTVATLKDSYLNTNTTVDLSTTNSVSFTVTADAASYARNRFSLILNVAAPLPVSFVSMHVYQNNNIVGIDWKVAAENAIQYYEVEHSTNGVNFTTAGTVKATGNTAYSFNDQAAVAGDNYYRVKSVGANGEVKYTDIAKLTIGKTAAPGFNVYPNPVQDNKLNLAINNQPKGTYGVRLLNTAGQLVYRSVSNHNGGSSTEQFNLPTLAKGIYKLEITTADKAVNVMNVFVK